MIYNLLLQTVVNEMVHQVWDSDVVFVILFDTCQGHLPTPVLFDSTTLCFFEYTNDGFYLELFSDDQKRSRLKVSYQHIIEIVGYYHNFTHSTTLYFHHDRIDINS